MATWGEIVDQLSRKENLLPDGRPNHDKVRREYLAALFQKTGRPTIVYSSGWLDKEGPASLHSITLGDLQGFMNAAAKIRERDLDLLLTSPGGSPDAAESILAYLRTQFDHIRVFVPVAAMSAATMLALGSNEIVMGAHSQLGPIDPQFTIQTPDGPRSAPAKAILDQFEQAREDCREPLNIAAWMPILRSYSPGLLAMCRDQQDLAQSRVEAWLKRYMLNGEPDAAAKAKAAARWFADYEYFGSHGRRVSLHDVLSLGLRVSPLEEDDDLQNAVLSVHHCYSLTHANSPAAKIIENHLGRAYVKMHQEGVVAVPAQPDGAAKRRAPDPNRAARRRAKRGRS